MRSRKTEHKKEIAVDVVRDILVWLVVTGISFVYWTVVLLMISLFLLNIWHVTFAEILSISIVLMILTSAGYAGVVIYRRFR